MNPLKIPALFIGFSIFCCSCKKEVNAVSNAPLQLGQPQTAQLGTGIIHRTVNRSITILPLPSRNGDILSKTVTRYIDLNGDKVNDFSFKLYWSRNDYPYQNNDASTPSISGKNNGDSVLTDYLYYIDYFGARLDNFARAVTEGTDIQTTAPPFNAYALLGTQYHVPPYYYSGGELIGLGNKLCGIKFKYKNGETHYGWMRVNLDNDGNTLALIDFAYNSVADRTIAAGAY